LTTYFFDYLRGVMEKEIREGQKLFYGDPIFSRGLSRSGYFSLRESQELQVFGDTLQQLASGALVPINDVEQSFVDETSREVSPTLYASKLWKKYLAAITKSKTFHSFTKSCVSSSASVDFAEGGEFVDIDD